MAHLPKHSHVCLGFSPHPSSTFSSAFTYQSPQSRHTSTITTAIPTTAIHPNSFHNNHNKSWSYSSQFISKFSSSFSSLSKHPGKFSSHSNNSSQIQIRSQQGKGKRGGGGGGDGGGPRGGKGKSRGGGTDASSKKAGPTDPSLSSSTNHDNNDNIIINGKSSSSSSSSSSANITNQSITTFDKAASVARQNSPTPESVAKMYRKTAQDFIAEGIKDEPKIPDMQDILREKEGELSLEDMERLEEIKKEKLKEMLKQAAGFNPKPDNAIQGGSGPGTEATATAGAGVGPKKQANPLQLQDMIDTVETIQEEAKKSKQKLVQKTTDSKAGSSSSTLDTVSASAPAVDADNMQKITEDGLVKKKVLEEAIARAGSKSPSPGDSVTVHYKGTIDATNVVFDSSYDRKQPFTFTLGKGTVIRGWELAIPSMKKGEKALISVAAQYAYGRRGVPPVIPGNATLAFEIELIDFVPTTAHVEPKASQPSPSAVDTSASDSASKADLAEAAFLTGEKPFQEEKSDLPRTPDEIADAYLRKIADNTVREKDDSTKKVPFLERFYFISPFASQTGEKPPWWLNPNITFVIVFLVVAFAFYVVFVSGGVHQGYVGPDPAEF